MEFSAFNQPSGAGVSPNKRTGTGPLTKTLLAMKLTIVFLTAAFFHVQASGVAQSVTLTAQQMPLRSVFKLIEKQTGYSVFYNNEYIRHAKPVTVDAHEMPLKDFLAVILKQENLTFEISQENILIREKPEVSPKKPATPLPGLEPPIRISGTISDMNKQPLIGATIRVKGQKASTLTNDRGGFQITVDRGDILIISHVGFQEKEVKVTGANTLHITLEAAEDVLDMAEVVYTGYQTISRERSAGAISKADMSIVANRSSSPNILQRLDGLVPGLVINTAPDAEPFIIRGLTSLNAAKSPLIVVDGVELPTNNTEGITDPDIRNSRANAQNNVLSSSNPIANINPQDIADISILRDASAASIWGSKAANGVIIITTKRGRAGEKLRIEYDGYYNFQGRPDLKYIPKLNSRDFITVAKELFPLYAPNNTWGSVQALAPVAPHLQVQYDRYRGLITQAQADKSLDSLASINNMDEILDVFYRNAATTNHTVSLSGGGQVHSFYGSVSYTGMQSSTPGEKNNSYKINLRQDFNLNKRIQLSLITDLTKSDIHGTNQTTPGTGFVPYQLFQDASGNPLTVNYLGNYSDSIRLSYAARSRVNLDYVPLTEATRGYSTVSGLSGRVVGGAKVNLLKGLRFEGTYGYQTFSTNSRNVLDEQSYTVRDELMSFTQADDANSIPRYWLPNEGGRLTVNNSIQKNWTVRNQLVFDQTWKEHQVTVLAGQEATNITPLATSAIYRGWDDQLQISRPVNYDTLAKGISDIIPGGTRVLGTNLGGGEGIVVRTTSYYSTLGYSYLRKYALNASWRIDKSNLFGFDKSAQNRPVYSVGGKWMLGRENFMMPLSWLDRLDVRVTYGITGNAPRPGQSASFDILMADANVNYVNGVGIVVSTPANNKLTWEGTTVYNTGLDFAVLGGRLGGSVDVYVKKTTDLIGPLNTAPLTGFSSVTGNFGDLENKGIELSLNSINVKGKDYMWNTMLTLAYNKNKITRLATAAAITTGEGMVLPESPFFVDRPAYTLFAFNYAGLNADGDPQITQADGKLLATRNGSKAEDVLYMGSSQPNLTGGLFNTFQYKGLQLGINISFNAGHVLFRDFNTYWNEPLLTNAMHSEFVNRWKVAGDENKTNIPRYAATSDIAESRNTSYYGYASTNAFDASYAKIREITLSYNLPQNMVRLVRVQGVSFRAQVSNLMLWKANKLGIDPEFQTAYGARTIRTGQGTITIGAHITL